jgi:hypothetical protein
MSRLPMLSKSVVVHDVVAAFYVNDVMAVNN